MGHQREDGIAGRKINEKGDIARLKHGMRTRLVEHGLCDDMKEKARGAIQERGVTEITVDELVSLLIKSFSSCVSEKEMEVAIKDARKFSVGIDEQEVKSLFSCVLASLCVEIACRMHRMVKTGVMPLSSIMIPVDTKSRRTHHGGREHGQNRCSPSISSEKGVLLVDLPSKRPKLEEDNDFKKINHAQTAVGVFLNIATVQQSGPVTRGTANDIWGRLPPKEPLSTEICTLCGRNVSALRFAPHLDKCMGVGNSRRGRPNL